MVKTAWQKRCLKIAIVLGLISLGIWLMGVLDISSTALTSPVMQATPLRCESVALSL